MPGKRKSPFPKLSVSQTLVVDQLLKGFFVGFRIGEGYRWYADKLEFGVMISAHTIRSLEKLNVIQQIYVNGKLRRYFITRIELTDKYKSYIDAKKDNSN